MYMLNMVIILIVMYCNVVTAIDKIPMYLLRFNKKHGKADVKLRQEGQKSSLLSSITVSEYVGRH